MGSPRHDSKTMPLAMLALAILSACHPAAAQIAAQIGNPIVARETVDGPVNGWGIQFVDTSLVFRTAGSITTWEIFTGAGAADNNGRDLAVDLQVWRMVSSHTYQLICETTVAVTTAHVHMSVSSAACEFESGDVIGWHHTTPGVIEYDSHSDDTNVLWGSQIHPGVAGSVEFTNTGGRAYSIMAHVAYSPEPEPEPEPEPALVGCAASQFNSNTACASAADSDPTSATLQSFDDKGCAADDSCTHAECCGVPNVCSASAYSSDSGCAADNSTLLSLLEPTRETYTCAGTNCLQSECCGPRGLCSELHNDTACAAAAGNATGDDATYTLFSPPANGCVDLNCTHAECCSQPGVCSASAFSSDAECAAGNNTMLILFDARACEGLNCRQEECCGQLDLCSRSPLRNDTGCAAGAATATGDDVTHTLFGPPAGDTCAGLSCTQTECCSQPDVCSASAYTNDTECTAAAASATGNSTLLSLFGPQVAMWCAASACTHEECCTPPGICSASAFSTDSGCASAAATATGDGTELILAEAHGCVAVECTHVECCSQVDVCSASLYDTDAGCATAARAVRSFDLSLLSNRDLRARATSVGANSTELSGSADSDNPRESLISLVLAHESLLDAPYSDVDTTSTAFDDNGCLGLDCLHTECCSVPQRCSATSFSDDAACMAEAATANGEALGWTAFGPATAGCSSLACTVADCCAPQGVCASSAYSSDSACAAAAAAAIRPTDSFGRNLAWPAGDMSILTAFDVDGTCAGVLCTHDDCCNEPGPVEEPEAEDSCEPTPMPVCEPIIIVKTQVRIVFQNTGCDGVPDSGAVPDSCRICGGDNSTCTDCKGVINGNAQTDQCNSCNNEDEVDCTSDCYGIWGGGAILDDCSICVPTGGTINRCLDCAGVVFGDNLNDKCGNCDNSTLNDCAGDCGGVWGGASVVDTCGVCAGDNSTCTSTNVGIGVPGFSCDPTEMAQLRSDLLAAYRAALGDDIEIDIDLGCGSRRLEANGGTRRLQGGGISVALPEGMGDAALIDLSSLGATTELIVYDCFGNVVESGVTDYPQMDACTVCDGTNVTCSDCSGMPNGNKTTDQCATCDANAANDCWLDCFGVWGGGALKDACQVCNGTNATCADCAGVPYGNSTLDECDRCDLDVANNCEMDCMGVWGGGNVTDECDVCKGTNECIVCALGQEPCSPGECKTPFLGCRECRNGTQSSGGTNICEPCGDGEQPTPELSSCMPCADGKAGFAGVCDACGAGMQPNADKTVCEACGVGKVSPIGLPCEFCAAGSEPNSDRATCTTCPFGEASNEATEGLCVRCTIGHEPTDAEFKFVGSGGAVLCNPCEKGKYSEFGFQCVQCPEFGMTTALTGATSEDDCVCEAQKYNSVTMGQLWGHPSGYGDMQSIEVMEDSMHDIEYELTCVKCPPKGSFITCPVINGTGGTPLLAPGYAEAPEVRVGNARHIFKCAFKKACPPRELENLPTRRRMLRRLTSHLPNTTNVTIVHPALHTPHHCAEMYTGLLCGLCQEGHTLSKDGCIYCKDGDLLKMFIWFAMVPVFCGIIYAIWKSCLCTLDRSAQILLYVGIMQVSHGLQRQSLWRIPTAAVS